MEQLSTPQAALIAYGLAHLGLLAAIALILLRPFAPGTLVAGLTTLGYAGYTTAMVRSQPTLAALWPVGVVGLLVALSLVAPRLSERLGIRYTVPQPPIVMGAFLGLVFGALVLGGGMAGQLVGLALGTFLAGFGQSRTGWRGALQAGPASFYTAMGPRAFELLLALAVGDLAVTYILHRVGVVQTPLP
ncbi:MAG: hypothetical protein VKS61_00365 [Candidatus Sericytochromatia bacterium]|nr:hypothetical protein [Candidatus Sericytochromatia bacterium]